MEQNILSTINLFVQELKPVQEHRDGTGLTLSLTVGLPGRYESSDKPKIQLQASFYDGSNHQTVKAASLDSLMVEVKRRLGFEDRESVRLQALEESFVALPPLDEIQF